MDDDNNRSTAKNDPTQAEGKPKEQKGEGLKSNTKARRQICHRCNRPLPAACICEALPEVPIKLDRTGIVVLQHPHELKIKNRSIPILELCLDDSSLGLCVGRRFDKELIDPKIIEILEAPDHLPVLFFPPDNDEKDVISLIEAKKIINDKLPEGGKVIIVALDATWKYAKEMHRANLQENLYPSNLIRVSLQPSDFPKDWVSGRFNIRTTPKKGESTLGFMSTVECIAWAASELGGPNNSKDLFATLMKPLDLMVAKWNAFCKQPKVRKTKAPQKKRRRDEYESS
ncbi:unnamed protein product [Cylindrotheca closterium]|uniref:tRNA-uridine aminocarboxypropyltransferase n=1 Tax=Cylindrotheca closterium TaxID=2856 RepID=A0AAD2G8P4_9STRA|nr:unnamed protein product [Cylindrotheca closterium]